MMFRRGLLACRIATPALADHAAAEAAIGTLGTRRVVAPLI